MLQLCLFHGRSTLSLEKRHNLMTKVQWIVVMAELQPPILPASAHQGSLAVTSSQQEIRPSCSALLRCPLSLLPQSLPHATSHARPFNIFLRDPTPILLGTSFVILLISLLLGLLAYFLSLGTGS